MVKVLATINTQSALSTAIKAEATITHSYTGTYFTCRCFL